MAKATDVGRGVFAAAGLSPARPLRGGTVTLAAEILGGDFLRESERAQFDGCTAVIGGETKIVVKSGLRPQRLNFAIARMLARLELRASGDWTPELEGEVAGYRVAPAEAFGARVRVAGLRKMSELARPFAITETCAALRVLEIGIASGAVVTPSRVYRPRAGLGWVRDEHVRAMLKAAAPRSVRKVTIADEPDRAALFKVAS